MTYTGLDSNLNTASQMREMQADIERLRAENKTLRNFINGIHQTAELALAHQQQADRRAALDELTAETQRLKLDR